MLSRRGHRLSRFRKNKRRLRERLRQRIFFRDKVVPEAMEKPRVLVLTGAGISAESGIRTFRAADGLWEEHRVEDVATPEGFDRDPELVQAFYNARRRQLQLSTTGVIKRLHQFRIAIETFRRCHIFNPMFFPQAICGAKGTNT